MVKSRLTQFIIALLLFSAAFFISCPAFAEIKYPNVKPTGFVQFWAWYDETAGPNHGDDLEVARARVGIKGNLSPNTDYFVLTEWGRLTYDDPVSLLDAWVNLKVNPALNIKLGQTWYKFSLSAAAPLPSIPFIYRPEVIDGIWQPMGRSGSYGYDKGVELWADLKDKKIPWGYVFSVTNGNGLRYFENNGKKDFVGRLYLEPKKDLKLGVSGFYGYSRVAIISNLKREEKKDLPEYAWGYDISYTKQKFRFIYEYLQGLYEGYLEQSGTETFHTATNKPRGWYVMCGFKPLSWIEFPVQYAWYEKDSVKGDTGLETITLGVTWTLKKKTLSNIKLNYIIRSAQANYGSKPRNMFAFQTQLVF